MPLACCRCAITKRGQEGSLQEQLAYTTAASHYADGHVRDLSGRGSGCTVLREERKCRRRVGRGVDRVVFKLRAARKLAGEMDELGWIRA